MCNLSANHRVSADSVKYAVFSILQMCLLTQPIWNLPKAQMGKPLVVQAGTDSVLAIRSGKEFFMSTTNTVIGVYENMTIAENAVRTLDEHGFPVDRISIIGQDLQSEKEVHGFVTTGDVAKSGAGAGAWLGGLFGLLMGAAFIWVPGFGPLMVAGPFAAALLSGIEGAVAGAAGGGLLGALVGWGVSKQHIVKYEDHIKSGKYLVIVHGGEDEIEEAKDILSDTSASELVAHS
jgi:hypothetical protein